MTSGCPPDCVSVTSGKKITAVDFRLLADPPITSLDSQLASLLPGESNHLNPGIGRFSPDGKYFAIALARQTSQGVFVYDLTSETLRQVADSGAELAWGADDTLYVQGSGYFAGTGHVDFYFAASISGTKVETRTITDFPDDIKAEFQQELSGEAASNDRYILSADRRCRGCPDTLTAKRTDGSDEQVIADIDRNFIFDGKNSIVFYPDGNEIVSYNLASKRSQRTALPVEAQDLIDQTHEGASHLVAYYANRPCEPDAASEKAESDFLVPSNVDLRRQQPPAIHVCFAKIP